MTPARGHQRPPHATLEREGARTATPRQVTRAALSCPVQAIAVGREPPDA